jgi:parallel beta-helix repeat protein
MKISMVLLLLAGATITARTSAEAQTAPALNESGYLGVPAPGFGLNTRPLTPTHFVNNTHITATDSGNPTGTAVRPRRTVPTVLPAGAVVEVRGGPYTTGNLTWTSQGTLERPVFVIGVGNPLFQGDGIGHRIVMAGSFMIVDGLTFNGVKFDIVGQAMSLRNSVIRNTNTPAVVVLGNRTVLHNNEIHNNGDPNATTERDTHGVLVVPGAQYTWILGNNIHHNGGDAIQVGSVATTEPVAQYVYIAANYLHEDRENGVDIKMSRHVVVASNRIMGYYPRSSSSGEAIVVHNNPSFVWILNNAVGYASQGIVCTGADVYVVAGNLIANVRGNGLNPNNLYSTSGILTYSSTRTFHVNNTISASDAGISLGGSSPTEVVNNIVTGLTQATVPIRFSSSTTRAASTVSNNYTGANPGFVDPERGDFRVLGSAPIVDAGMNHFIFAAYRQIYGVSLGSDLYGGQRQIGGAVDIGAAEFQPPR